MDFNFYNMMKSRSIFQLLKPGIPKRYLLFVAALVWTFAGSMLLIRGELMIPNDEQLVWLKLLGSLVGGICFFVFLFSKISLKHSRRIINMEEQRPCLFSFFNFKSYLMMTLMISMGILLRKTGIVPLSYLSFFYILMGIPLLMSSFRFYYYGFRYSKATENLTEK